MYLDHLTNAVSDQVGRKASQPFNSSSSFPANKSVGLRGGRLGFASSAALTFLIGGCLVRVADFLGSGGGGGFELRRLCGVLVLDMIVAVVARLGGGAKPV